MRSDWGVLINMLYDFSCLKWKKQAYDKDFAKKQLRFRKRYLTFGVIESESES